MSAANVKANGSHLNAFYTPKATATVFPPDGKWHLAADSDVTSKMVMHGILDRQSPDMFVLNEKSPSDVKKAK